MAKLLIAVVHAQDADQLREQMRKADLRVTEVPSRGGFLQERGMMLFIALEDEQVGVAMRLIEENCRSRTHSVPIEPLGGIETSWLPTEVTQGGATVFVLPLDEIRRI
jgi:uncharacterized protein YaaQ